MIKYDCPACRTTFYSVSRCPNGCKPPGPPAEVPCEFDPMYGRCRITTEHACSAKPEVPAPDWEAMVAREKNGYDEVKAPDEVIHLVNEHGEIRVWNAEPSTLDYIVKTFGLKPVRYVRSRS